MELENAGLENDQKGRLERWQNQAKKLLWHDSFMPIFLVCQWCIFSGPVCICL